MGTGDVTGMDPTLSESQYHYHLCQIISTFVAVYAMSKSLHDDNHSNYLLCF